MAIYIISVYICVNNCFWNTGLPIYLSSIENLEINIYFFVFIFIVLFIQNCFLQYENEKNKITVALWFINSIGMAILLFSLAFIIPFIEPSLKIEEHLQWYYSTMAQVFASILAIVAVFYTALPNKNIITINVRKKAIDYKHPAILHQFIIINGGILFLVFLGLSSGVHITFQPFLEFSSYNLLNIFSIALFEVTLLMIPPAISCLYALIRITAFTGTVRIASKPSRARIYIDGYDTRLATPTKLMLHEGIHSVSLMDTHDLTKTKPIRISVESGTEQKIFLNISKLFKDTLE